MEIRKTFKAESAHLVRNVGTSIRCSKSIHGHSTKIEVILESNHLDYGQMIVDFGLLKNEIGIFIDSFDHCYLLWDKESERFKNFIYEYSDRVITLPVSPSAESLSLLILFVVDKIIKNTVFANNEIVKAKSVRYHETETGYAESNIEDLKMINYTLNDIIFSNGVINEWKNKEMWNDLINGKKFIKKPSEQQIICS